MEFKKKRTKHMSKLKYWCGACKMCYALVFLSVTGWLMFFKRSNEVAFIFYWDITRSNDITSMLTWKIILILYVSVNLLFWNVEYSKHISFFFFSGNSGLNRNKHTFFIFRRFSYLIWLSNCFDSIAVDESNYWRNAFQAFQIPKKKKFIVY